MQFDQKAQRVFPGLPAETLLADDVKEVRHRQRAAEMLALVSDAQADEPNPSLSQLKILVVDDSSVVRMMLTALLHTFGINHIVECSDGAGALRTVEKDSFDLVLTDFSMRPMDGVEFTRQLRRPGASAKPSLPVLFLSSHSEKAVVKAALEAGGSDYLVKPISRAGLLDKITSLVGNPRPVVQGTAYWGPDRRRKKRLAQGNRSLH